MDLSSDVWESFACVAGVKRGRGMTVRPNADPTDSGGGEGESGVSPLGEEFVIAEEKFLHFKHPAHFGGKSHGRPDSFFPLNFNVYINLDNRERARARSK